LDHNLNDDSDDSDDNDIATIRTFPFGGTEIYETGGILNQGFCFPSGFLESVGNETDSPIAKADLIVLHVSDGGDFQSEDIFPIQFFRFKHDIKMV
jgi:hypothetical protein